MEDRSYRVPTAAGDVVTAFFALELSGGSWVVACQLPRAGSPSLHKLAAGDVCGVAALAERGRAAGARRVMFCYEAGRDGFWLCRLLAARGIECHVLDPASLPVNRRARRAKSDRIDVRMLLRALIAWAGGDRGACRMVRVPSVSEEDAKRAHREREGLIGERVRHVNRIKALLALHGVTGFEPLRRGSRERLTTLAGADGAPLPPALLAAVERALDRLALVTEQIAVLEAERDRVLKQPACGDAVKIVRLAQLKGIGAQLATVLTREVFYRRFEGRREVAGYVGLAPTPWRSGGIDREQGIGKSGNPRARTAMIELAWLWLRYQEDSQLSRWFRARTGESRGRVRRIAVVALARKLLVALWRYVETGLVPSGAILKPS